MIDGVARGRKGKQCWECGGIVGAALGLKIQYGVEIYINVPSAAVLVCEVAVFFCGCHS